MTRRSLVWVVAGAVFGVLSQVAIPAPGGVLSLTAAGHLAALWTGFAAVAVLDVTVLRRVERRTADGQVPE